MTDTTERGTERLWESEPTTKWRSCSKSIDNLSTVRPNLSRPRLGGQARAPGQQGAAREPSAFGQSLEGLRGRVGENSALAWC